MEAVHFTSSPLSLIPLRGDTKDLRVKVKKKVKIKDHWEIQGFVKLKSGEPFVTKHNILHY